MRRRQLVQSASTIFGRSSRYGQARMWIKRKSATMKNKLKWSELRSSEPEKTATKAIRNYNKREFSKRNLSFTNHKPADIETKCYIGHKQAREKLDIILEKKKTGQKNTTLTMKTRMEIDKRGEGFQTLHTPHV